jgi:branched-chain amino acid transport system substrate-binding protein
MNFRIKTLLRTCVIVLLTAAALAPAAHKFRKIDKDKTGPRPLRPISANYIKKSKVLFRQGYKQFAKGDFTKALADFKKLLRWFGRSPIAEETAVLAAQCHIRLDNYKEAMWILGLFPKKHPKSVYLDRCYYLQALIMAYEGDYFGAARQFLNVHQSGRNPVLRDLARGALVLLFETRLTIEQIDALEKEMGAGADIRGHALYYTALLHINRKKFDEALDVLKQFKKAFRKHTLYPKARELRALAENKREAAVKIGVLVPVNAENSLFNEYGASVLKGIKTALAFHNRSSALKAKMVLKDTRANAVTTYQVTRELLEKDTVAAIIGPLTSEGLCVTAALTRDRNIPVISPTASAMDIDSLGDHVFLLTAPKTALPNDEYGSVMAGAFRDEIEAKGGTLVAYDMYEKGEKNFKDIVERLHEKKVEAIFAARALERGEIIGRAEERVVMVDSFFMADSAVDIGGIFMPGYPDEIIMLGPQIPFYKIHTQMLGAAGWYDNAVLKHAGRYLEDAIVVMDFINNEKSKTWKAFQDRYRREHGEAPDMRAGLGFDAMQLVLKNVRKLGDTKVLRRLRKVRAYEGACCRIVFDKATNANKSAVLLQIKDEEFQRIYPR